MPVRLLSIFLGEAGAGGTWKSMGGRSRRLFARPPTPWSSHKMFWSTKMRSETPGTVTSEIEVTNISRHGFWLLLEDRELFLPFEEFPWFADAPVNAILKVERPERHHLYWPDLDIDLAVESIEHPDRFPLKARGR
jgi:hypothetical protein